MVQHLRFLLVLLCSSCLYSCDKADVVFSDNSNVNDPSLVYLDDQNITLETLKLDSFVTSGHDVFMCGSHPDAFCGKINADSYAEILLPATNPVDGLNVAFDSLELIVVPQQYYGDTTMPFYLGVHQLTSMIENDDNNDTYYSPREFASTASPIGAIRTVIQPGKKKELKIKLADYVGQDLLNKFKNDRPEVQTQDDFREYLKGFCLKTDTSFNKTIYYFNGTSGGKALLRLHYRVLGSISTSKSMEFEYKTAKQYNHLWYNFSQSPFQTFPATRPAYRSSGIMLNKAYVQNNISAYARISFPDLFNLKELHPYVKVIRAILEVEPAKESTTFPYQLPETLAMYISNGSNRLDGILTDDGGYTQSGNLLVDDLYGKDTRYSFDITSHINTLLTEGRLSTKVLLLGSPDYGDVKTYRLLINEQGSTQTIHLKLYVLGL